MKKVIFIFLIIAILIIIGMGLWGYWGLKNKHDKEINYFITSKGGEVVRIEESTFEGSPFKESGKLNTIYKITYEKNGKKLVAWYRAINNFSNIHQVTKNSYKEEWIIHE